MEGAAARQEEINEREDKTLVRQIEETNKQRKKKKTRRRAYFFYNSTGFLYYKFFLTDWIATESKALHGELSATRRTQHRHERGREEAFRQKVSNLKSL